jgi:hypothetical protein
MNRELITMLVNEIFLLGKLSGQDSGEFHQEYIESRRLVIVESLVQGFTIEIKPREVD